MTDLEIELEYLRDVSTSPLFQENWGTGMARLLDALEAVLKMHVSVGVYDECDCTDEQKESSPHEDVEEVGTTCNHLYDICVECCRVNDYQTEDCANYHIHTIGGDYCPTVTAITTALGDS